MQSIPCTSLMPLVDIVRWNSDIHHDVDSVRHVEVKICRPNVRAQRRPIRDVHLRTKVGADEMFGEMRHEVERPRSMGVVGEWQRLQQVAEPARQQVGEIVARRPVFQLEDSRAAEAVAHPRPNTLKAGPEVAHRTPEEDHAVAAVHEVGC